MPTRLWNSFNLLAVVLFVISVAGLLSGGKMVFDPGREQTGMEWMIYLFAAVLMVINGFLPTQADPPARQAVEASPVVESSEANRE